MQSNEVFFFFSSRRRHTRYWRDWSSDVCSSDLPLQGPDGMKLMERSTILSICLALRRLPGRSEERRVGKGVDLGGRRIIKKKNKSNILYTGEDVFKKNSNITQREKK